MLPAASIFLAVAAVALISVLAGAVAPVVAAHAFFAVAALPLMFAAILHFVPVLTRGAAASGVVALVPWAGIGAGLVAVATFAGALPRHGLLLAATVNALAALATALWILQRARRALGRPHPGAFWYPAALLLLAVAMLAVFGMLLDGARYDGWRRLHQHLNLFGWIALTALGTLPVLLPTAAGRADPGAALRLRRWLPAALAAALLLATGAAAGWIVVAALGAAGLVAVAGVSLLAWLRLYGRQLVAGVPSGLALATAFLIVLLIAGALHGGGGIAGAALVPAFIYGFLLTLVTAALAQLLPVWRFPGARTPARDRFAAALAGGATARALLFVGAGVLQLGGVAAAPWLALAAMASLLASIAVAWRGAAG